MDRVRLRASRADRPDQLMIVRPGGTGARLLATEVAGIVGWSPDSASLAYTAGAWELGGTRAPCRHDRRRRGPGRVQFQGRAVRIRRPRWSEVPGEAVSPSLPAAVALGATCNLPIAAPPAGPPLQPNVSLGRDRVQDGGGEFDCYVGVLRFPDQALGDRAATGRPSAGGARRRARPRDAEAAAGRLLRVALQTRRVRWSCARRSAMRRSISHGLMARCSRVRSRPRMVLRTGRLAAAGSRCSTAEKEAVAAAR